MSLRMPSPQEPINSELPDIVGRRSTRLSMIVPITIQGTDTFGQPFKENTWTIGINKQGARIATFHTLASGSHLWILNPVLGRTAKGRVIWLGEKRFPEDPYEVGVELTEDQNVWGINFPPEDWQKGTAPGSPPLGQEMVSGAEAVLEIPGAASPAGGTEQKGSQAEKVSVEKPLEQEAEKLSQFNLALAALSHFAQQAEVSTEAPGSGASTALEGTPSGVSAAEAFGAQAAQRTPEGQSAPRKIEPSSPVGQPDPPAQAGLQELAHRLDEKEKSLRSLETNLNNLLERLRASQEKIEPLLAGVSGLPRLTEAEPETSRRTVRREWLDQTRGQLEVSIRTFCETLQRQLEDACRTALEKTRGESESLLQELRARLELAARALRGPSAPFSEPSAPAPQPAGTKHQVK